MSKKSNESDVPNDMPKDDNVKMRVTRLGAGKVSTGFHVAALGETMAETGAILTVPGAVADELEARGLAEIQ